MSYRINIHDKTVVEDLGNLGPFFFSEDWRECTEQEIEDYKISELKPKMLNSRKSYLNNTDWYIIRKIERGVEVPSNITLNRVKALEEIDQITLLNSIDELEKIETNFVKSEA